MADVTTPPPLHTRMSTPAQLLLFACFSIFFLCIRIPQFTAQWDGEDANGHLSAMLMGLAPPNEMIESRVDGVARYQVGFQHPLPPYLLISLIGRVVRVIVPLTSLHGQTLIFALKATVTVLQLGIFLMLLFLALRYARTFAGVVWVWVMAVTPVALYSSNEVQPDSSTGLLFIALFFLAAVIAQSDGIGRTARMLWLVAGGFAAGLGKNEWTFCLTAAVVFTALAHPLISFILSRRMKIDAKDPSDAMLVLLAASIGLVAGNVANYLVNPYNYVAGWELLRSMIFPASILSGNTHTWWGYFIEKLPYIFFHFVVDAAILIQFLRRPQIYSVILLLAAAFANTLFFSYVISSWGSFPRYFAPAFIGLGICFLIVLMRLPARDGRNWTVAATILLVALQSLYYQWTTPYWQLWRGNTDIPAWIAKYENDPGHCVLVVDYSLVLDRPNINFVHAPFGADAIERYLASIGRSACPHW